MVQRIELAFNQMWHVRTGRSLPRSVSDFLIVLLVGPVILFTAAGATAALMSTAIFRQMTSTPLLSDVIALARTLVPELVAALGFSVIYMLLPNTRVRPGSALIGGVAAGLMWALASWIFGGFVASFDQLHRDLFGVRDDRPVPAVAGCHLSYPSGRRADIAFYHQHPEYLLVGWRELRPSYLDRLRIALSAARDIGRTVYVGERPPTVETLAGRLHVADDIVANVLDDLAEAQLIVATNQRPPRFVPAGAVR